MAGGPSGVGPIRETVESLLRAQRAAEEIIGEVHQDARRRMTLIADLVRQAGAPPDSAAANRATAERIDAVADATGPSFVAAAEQTSLAFSSEVHALLGLLNAAHRPGGVLPSFDPATVIHGRSMQAAFPEGFARDYVATVVADLDDGRSTVRASAGASPPVSDGDIDVSMQRVVAVVSNEHRQQIEAILNQRHRHAVGLHGPHVTDRELEYRVGWTRPPNHGASGAYTWRLRPTDRKVVSEHLVGVEACRFNTPEAFTRPLEAFLDVANQHDGGLDGFLDEHSKGGLAPFYIGAQRASLDPGDTFGYRGAGTGTDEAARDWVKMRAAAMRPEPDCLRPVRTIPFDPVADGADPGVWLVFKKRSNGWELTTYYPDRQPASEHVRLEDIA